MPFPFSIQRSLTVPTANITYLMDAVEAALIKEKPSQIHRSNDRIHIRNNLFRWALGWNLINHLRSAVLQFALTEDRQKTDIQYEVTLNRNSSVLILLAAGIYLVTTLVSAAPLQLSVLLLFFPTAALYFATATYLVCRWQFHHLIRKNAEAAAATAPPASAPENLKEQI